MTIFDLLYLAGAAPAAPFVAFKMLSDRRFTDRFSERLGYAPRQEKCVWFHAASVGEVNAIRTLGKEIAKSSRVVITTMTRQGRENASRTFPQAAVSYAPLDWSPCVSRFVARVRPSLIAVVEQELWPNMILNAPCPVILVNARMTERSAQAYRRLGGLFRRVMKRIDLVLAQNEEYAARYRSLGALRVEVVGNLKFDALPQVDEAAERARYRAKFGEPLLVAGSTSEPEEEILIQAYSELRKQFPALKLVIAPRHLERVPEIRKKLPPGVGLLDTMGELYKLYCAATVTFVGGSFGNRGGQSVIEPASLGKPIVTGPDLRNFAEVAERLQDLGALKIASNPVDLVPLLGSYMRNPSLGEPGRKLIQESKGSTRRASEALLGFL